MIEPMRIVLFFSLLYSNKYNQYFLALLLPIISFAVSGHPPLVKTIIIILELGFNVYLLNLFIGKKINLFLSIFISTVISKILYYIIKLFIYSYILKEEFEIGKERIIEQIILILLLSTMIYMINQLKEKKKFKLFSRD
jgi:hypothetical protein